MREQTYQLQEFGIADGPGVDIRIGCGGPDVVIGVHDEVGVGIEGLEKYQQDQADAQGSPQVEAIAALTPYEI